MIHDSRILLNLQKIFFFLIILFLPTQLGYHFWPVWSYVSGLRIDYLSPTLYFTDLLIIFLFLLWIVLVFPILKSRIKNYELRIKSKKNIIHYSLFIIPFIIFLLVGIFLSKNPQAGLYGLAKLFEFGFFGWYTSQFIKNKKDFGILVLIFSLSVCFESLLAIAQYIQQGSIGGIFYFFGERTFTSVTPGVANASIDGRLILRPYATFSHPNVLAGYLVIAMTFIFMNQESGIRNYGRIFFHGVLLIGTMALFLTMSRVAILLWIITASFFIFKNLNIKNSLKIKNYKLKILFVELICVVGIIIVFPFSSRFLHSSIAEESFTRRIDLIKTTIAMVKENPLIGVGLNNFLPNLSTYQKSTEQSLFSYLQPVHNIFLLIVSETGIVGLTFFLWFLIKTHRRIRNYESGIKGNKKFIIHYSLFIILMLGLFDHYFLTLQQGQLLLAFVLGFCWTKNKFNV